MKRLLTLILTFILTISGVFPAFAFSTNLGDWVNNNKSDWESPEYEAWKDINEDYVCVFEHKDCIFVMPFAFYKDGTVGIKVNLTKAWGNTDKTLQFKQSGGYSPMDRFTTSGSAAEFKAPKNFDVLEKEKLGQGITQYGIYRKNEAQLTYRDSAELECNLLRAVFYGLYGDKQRAYEEEFEGAYNAYDLAYIPLYIAGEDYGYDVEKLCAALKSGDYSSPYMSLLKFMLGDLFGNTSINGDKKYDVFGSTVSSSEFGSPQKQQALECVQTILNGTQDSSDGQQTEGDKGPVTPVEPEDEIDINDEFRMWYQAAFKVMSGATDWTGFDEKYKDANNLIALEPEGDRKSTRLNSSHDRQSRMPSSA